VAIKLALADDSPLVRDGLRQLLEGRPGIEVVAECEDLRSLLEATERERPDVVLTDMRMPPTGTDEGLQVAVRLGRTDPGVGVIVLGQSAEPVYAVALLASGTQGRGYLLKERAHDRARLAAAIEAVAAGGSVIDPKVVALLLSAGGSPANLSPPDLDLLALVAQGKSNSAIADELALPEPDVESRLASIFGRLGLPREHELGARVRSTVLALAGKPDS
jgi:DNA-binding NarL/FixJ family response regulator